MSENVKEKEAVREKLRAGYGEIARSGGSSCGATPTCCGSTPAGSEQLAKHIGYTVEELAALPDGANMGLSCGNPTALASLRPGAVVLETQARVGGQMLYNTWQGIRYAEGAAYFVEPYGILADFYRTEKIPLTKIPEPENSAWIRGKFYPNCWTEAGRGKMPWSRQDMKNYVRFCVELEEINSLSLSCQPFEFFSDYLLNPFKYCVIALLLYDGTRTRRAAAGARRMHLEVRPGNEPALRADYRAAAPRASPPRREPPRLPPAGGS